MNETLADMKHPCLPDFQSGLQIMKRQIRYVRAFRQMSNFHLEVSVNAMHNSELFNYDNQYDTKTINFISKLFHPKRNMSA